MGKSIIQDVINRAYAKVYRFYRTMITIRDILGSEIVPEGEYRTMERRRNQRFTLSNMLDDGQSLQNITMATQTSTDLLKLDVSAAIMLQ